MIDKLKACPDCGGTDRLFVSAVDLYKVNSGEFYCHSAKTHDDDAEVTCFACDWHGEQSQLVETEND